jgi:hypothetical protein
MLDLTVVDGVEIMQVLLLVEKTVLSECIKSIKKITKILSL